MASLDRYEIVRPLGQGAAGEVHLAIDRLGAGRRVALKRIRARVDEPLREAFEREFATMASLSLAGVAQVFDFGVLDARGDGAGGPFYTRGFVDGLPLDAAAAGGSLSERVALVARVARVLVPLHRAGVVHGDIKPGNAIIDAAGRAHIIDFGLSRVLGQHGGPGEGAGTPAFMAPELLRGASASVASDVYALGVTLWLLVTGELPFGGGMSGLEERRRGKLPALPADLDVDARRVLEVSLRALAPRPLDRFPSLGELCVALQEVVPAAAPRADELEMFVPPRPRGHEEVLATLQSLALSGAGVPGAPASVLLRAPRGGGKSLVLRGLKWRAQLRDAYVFELSVRGARALAPLIGLIEQLLLYVPEASAAALQGRATLQALRAGTLDATALSNALAGLLAELDGSRARLLLVDDLDAAEALLGEVLRSTIHADRVGRVVVVASAADAQAPAVRALGIGREVALPLLDRSQMAALVGDALGVVDESVIDALREHCQGLPASLIDALAALRNSAAPTAADVQALPQDDAGLTVARARLDRVSAEAGRLLEVFGVLGQPLALETLGSLYGAVGGVPASTEALALECELHALVQRTGDGLMLSDQALVKALRERIGPARIAELASVMLRAPRLDAQERARLAVISSDAEAIRSHVPEAAAALMQLGARAEAAGLYEALLAHTSDAAAGTVELALARCRHDMGEHEAAVELARHALGRAPTDAPLVAEAAVVAGRALTALARFDEAVEVLGRVPCDADAHARARVQRELAKVHLRRGDYVAVEAAVEAGLACAAPNDLVRVELLCSQGMVASYHSDPESARHCLEQALSLARAQGSRRDEANALASLAIAYFREGDYVHARSLTEQSVEIARELGDVGSMANYSTNLGALLMFLGDPGAAAESYVGAARLARRAGRLATEAQANANLAQVHTYFGLYERARAELSEVAAYAQGIGHRYLTAQVSAVRGDIAARTGDVERALIHYDDAIARYRELGQKREVADHELDAAEALLDRNGPADASAAAARLASARSAVDADDLTDLRLRLDLLLARGRIAGGEAEGVIAALDDVLARARLGSSREIEWSALWSAALAHELLGTEFAARKHYRLAIEVLEEIALRIPREHREAFWHDPRRRLVRQRAMLSEQGPSSSNHGRTRSDSGLGWNSELAHRLFEIIKRLAGEHDLDRLLERITESAVELSGAERGLVLLVGSGGQLETRTYRQSPGGRDDPHAAFSRSIAEAVLIDGEPIITVDATRDGRLSEYVSVHKLMLRSVACLPIQGPGGTLGVLYLEHRHSRGRFSEAAVELLNVFADQAAIALQNARLLRENRHRQEELEAANQALERAKRDLEDLLSTRTEALNEAHKELERARRDTRRSATRYGMVGRSPAMQRVFDNIERLAGAQVPVVIRGESGTGKELVARAIHYEGVRAKAPFIAINCGSLPETLLESELFGHVKGAFSGADRDKRGMIARASGGTLFLDEVGDMPPKMQIDLLRVLQEGTVCPLGGAHDEKVDVRFIAASHQPLTELVAQGRFREDLYYRLNVVEVALPPLRDRRDDVPLLCDHFLRSIAERDQRPEKRLSREALAALAAHPWPGNVRQLEHTLVQACVLADEPTLEVAALGSLFAGPLVDTLPPALSASPAAQALAAENVGEHRVDERRRILEALESHNWNRARAAKALGMPRRTFYRRLQDYAIL
jgi:serine/threonine-protein kinase PknK